MFTIDLAFDRPTKRTVRFAHPDYGTLYVPNEVYKQLGEPDSIRMTLSPAEGALKLAEAA